jgi:hypothetical protein
MTGAWYTRQGLRAFVTHYIPTTDTRSQWESVAKHVGKNAYFPETNPPLVDKWKAYLSASGNFSNPVAYQSGIINCSSTQGDILPDDEEI